MGTISVAGKKELAGHQFHLNGSFSLQIPRGWGGHGDVAVVVRVYVVVAVDTVYLAGRGRDGYLGDQDGMEGG